MQGRKSRTIEEFRNIINERFDNRIEVITDVYTNTKTKMKIKCHTCGYLWETTPEQLTRAKYGCPKCAKTNNVKNLKSMNSQGEIRIKELLDENNILYIQQFVFSNLKSVNNKFLFFDFAIIENEELLGVIEFNGQQHYRQGLNYSDKQFKDLQKNDTIKKEYCQSNNIPLIIVRYDEIKELTFENLIFK